ncbi:hypothetical protein [Ornithinimicrobium kibberense]|uniref:hypothetical protein n=1 Tax=Ornithinimicrobium kibberense TaxID=282060 RepID=UPI003609881C
MVDPRGTHDHPATVDPHERAGRAGPVRRLIAVCRHLRSPVRAGERGPPAGAGGHHPVEQPLEPGTAPRRAGVVRAVEHRPPRAAPLAGQRLARRAPSGPHASSGSSSSGR